MVRILSPFVRQGVADQRANRFKRTGKRYEIFLATKFGITRGQAKTVTGDPEYVKAACEKSLQRLGVDQIDLYYMHR